MTRTRYSRNCCRRWRCRNRRTLHRKRFVTGELVPTAGFFVKFKGFDITVGNGEVGSGVGALALCQHPVPVCSSCHALAARNFTDIIIVLAFVSVRERKDGEVKLHVPGVDVLYKLIPSDMLERINDHQFDVRMLR